MPITRKQTGPTGPVRIGFSTEVFEAFQQTLETDLHRRLEDLDSREAYYRLGRLAVDQEIDRLRAVGVEKEAAEARAFAKYADLVPTLVIKPFDLLVIVAGQELHRYHVESGIYTDGAFKEELRRSREQD